MLAPANGKGDLELFGKCKYYQNVATLTCGSGAVAGSGMVDVDYYNQQQSNLHV